MSKEIIADARDLLVMLETLTEGFSNKKAPADVPWSGISLTLGQCKRLLSEVLEEELQPLVSSQLADESSIRENTNSTQGSTLSSMIRPMPVLNKPVENEIQPAANSRSLGNGAGVRELEINLDTEDYSSNDLETEEGRFYFS